MPRTGRPRERTEPADWLVEKMPKKESEEHRQMRAYFLSLPVKQRTLKAVADQFNKSPDQVWLVATAFHWIDDAKARDSAIMDPFVEQHQTKIDEVRLKAFHFLCTALDKELARQAVELDDDAVIEKIKAKDIDGALKDWTAKEWRGFISTLSIKAKDFKRGKIVAKK